MTSTTGKTTIVGMRIEKFMNLKYKKNCQGDIDSDYELDDKFIFFAEDERHSKYEIHCFTEQCICSDYVIGQNAYHEVFEVKNFKCMTHKVIKPIICDPISNDDKTIKNKAFELDGFHGYYPEEYIKVNMAMFKPTIRHREKKPLWIFRGDSNSGKTYLGDRLRDLEIFETDSLDSRTSMFDGLVDVVIVGNKYNFSNEEIVKNTFYDADEVDVIEVNFKDTSKEV